MSEFEGLWGEAWLASFLDARKDGLSRSEAIREADQCEGALPIEMFRIAMRLSREVPE